MEQQLKIYLSSKMGIDTLRLDGTLVIKRDIELINNDLVLKFN